AETVLHLNGGERDVVGVLEHRDLAGAVESDVEFARQPRQRAVVEDVVVPFAGELPGVEQFDRIDTRGRRSRDVADVVGARTARAQADVLDALDQADGVLWRVKAQLKVGTGGDVRIAAGKTLSQVGKAVQLPVLQDAIRDSQPAHVGILRRRDIENAVIAPAEIVRWRRRGVVFRLFLEAFIGIERMLFALEFFRIRQLLAIAKKLVLRLQSRGIRTDGLGIRLGDGRA